MSVIREELKALKKLRKKESKPKNKSKLVKLVYETNVFKDSFPGTKQRGKSVSKKK